jgi:HD-GYP domain-containing protein (c-di-GMP phosphodiesterase class II)
MTSEASMVPILAGMVADIGLIDSHRDLLSFERAMTPPERAILHAHPHASSRLVRGCGLENEHLLAAVEHHHERIDGSGYPLGLGGTSVPQLAQIVGLADSFMTLVTARPRVAALQPGAAIDVLTTKAFDADLVATLAAQLDTDRHPLAVA